MAIYIKKKKEMMGFTAPLREGETVAGFIAVPDWMPWLCVKHRMSCPLPHPTLLLSSLLLVSLPVSVHFNSRGNHEGHKCLFRSSLLITCASGAHIHKNLSNTQYLSATILPSLFGTLSCLSMSSRQPFHLELTRRDKFTISDVLLY